MKKLAKKQTGGSKATITSTTGFATKKIRPIIGQGPKHIKDLPPVKNPTPSNQSSTPSDLVPRKKKSGGSTGAFDKYKSKKK